MYTSNYDNRVSDYDWRIRVCMCHTPSLVSAPRRRTFKTQAPSWMARSHEFLCSLKEFVSARWSVVQSTSTNQAVALFSWSATAAHCYFQEVLNTFTSPQFANIPRINQNSVLWQVTLDTLCISGLFTTCENLKAFFFLNHFAFLSLSGIRFWQNRGNSLPQIEVLDKAPQGEAFLSPPLPIRLYSMVPQPLFVRECFFFFPWTVQKIFSLEKKPSLT